MLGLLAIVLTTIVVYILKFHYTYVREIYLSTKIAGPRALPLLGNGLLFINKTSAGSYSPLTYFSDGTHIVVFVIASALHYIYMQNIISDYEIDLSNLQSKYCIRTIFWILLAYQCLKIPHICRKLRSDISFGQRLRWFYTSMAGPRIECCCDRSKWCRGKKNYSNRSIHKKMKNIQKTTSKFVSELTLKWYHTKFQCNLYDAVIFSICTTPFLGNYLFYLFRICIQFRYFCFFNFFFIFINK